MEYDIINEIITCTVTNLFQSPLSPDNPHLKSNIHSGSSTQAQRHQPTHSTTSISSDLSTTFQTNILENNGSPGVKKIEQNQEFTRNHNSKKSSSIINEYSSYQSINVNPNYEFVNINQNKDSINLTKKKEIDSQQEFRNLAKENTPKIDLTPPTSEQWIQKNGPQKLNEALDRLNLNINNINKVNLTGLSSKQLEAEKRNVKNELKRYDASFTEIFQRMPNRAEKEPMRPLYIYYKKIKQYLSKEESEEKITVYEGSKQQSLNNVSVEYEKNLTNNIFPEMVSRERENKKTPNTNAIGKKFESSSEENLNRDKIFGKGAYHENSYSKQEVPQKIEKKMAKEEARKKLEILDAVKTAMREKLHNYQVEFTKNNNRKIKYHKDIIPVEEEYKRYKEVKEEMSTLEEFLKS